MARPRISAAARVQRLLSMLQWAAEHQDGVPVDDLCERFGLARADLVKELELAMMVGGDSVHYDEMPFEVFVEDGLVYVRLFAFRRPLRLTPAEGLALVAAADVLVDRAAADGDQADGPSALARALAKLADLLGIEPGQNVDVDLDPDGGPTGRLLRAALHAGHQVAFTYWTYARDAVTERTVDPWALFNQNGAWYLVGRAHDADAERRFRLDRMDGVVELDVDRAVPPPRGRAAAAATEVAVAGPQVVLDLAPSAWWVAEAHPVEATEVRDDGRLRVTLAVAGSSWLERLLLRLGPEATVVAIDPELGDAGITAGAARRVLARYRAEPPEAAR